MSKPKPERKGGLQRLDPAVAAWQARAATNEAALTNKQRTDRERIRVRLDVPAALAAGLANEAAALETSQSQLGAFLLAWGLQRLHSGDAALTAAVEAARQHSHAINVGYDLVIPDAVLASH